MLSNPTVFHVLVFAVAFAMVGITTGLAIEGGSNPVTIVAIRMWAVIALFLVYFRAIGVSLVLTAREREGWSSACPEPERGGGATPERSPRACEVPSPQQAAGPLLRSPARDRNIALGIGVILCVNNWAINESLALIPVPLAILIFYLWPAITTAGGWLLGTDPFRWRGLFGIALAFAGLALTLNVELTGAQTKGVVLALFGACAWSATFLLVGHYFRGKDMRPITFFMTLVTAVVFTGLLATDVYPFLIPSDWRGWVGLITLPLFYAFGMIGLFVATARMGPMKVGFYMNFEPIASVVLAAVILQQGLAPIQLAGAALVIAALFLFRPPPVARAARSVEEAR